MVILKRILLSVGSFLVGVLIGKLKYQPKPVLAGTTLFTLVKGQLFIYNEEKHVVIHNDTTQCKIYAAKVVSRHGWDDSFLGEVVGSRALLDHADLEENIMVLTMASADVIKDINKLEH